MKKFLFIPLCLLLGLFDTNAQSNSQWSVGANGGIGNRRVLSADGYVQYKRLFRSFAFETNVGVNYRQFDAHYRSENNLDTKGVGLFTEIVAYPFRKLFFTGFRWDMLTLNKFSSTTARNLHSAYPEYYYTGIFSGTNLYAIAGIAIPLGKWIDFKLSIMPGFQQYNVIVEIGRTTQPKEFDFICQINAGLVLHLSSTK
jgi:hypothetical protein